MAKFDLKKAILENKATFFGSLTEGQFSWFTQDTDEQIGSEPENTITVYMHDNKGNVWKEDNYEGYGEFGGKDYYELLAQMNNVENADRSDGIDLAFSGKKVLFPALTASPKLSPSHDFYEEAENDPNQSWYAPEDNNDDYITGDRDDEYLDESEVKEAMDVAKDMTTQEAAGHAERFAKYMSDKEGKEFTVTAGSVEGPSFDLDLDGEEYDGGSYVILTNGDIVNMALPGNPVYANISMLNEAEKPKTKMKKSELKELIKSSIMNEIALDIDSMEDAPESEVDFLAEIDAILAEAEGDEEEVAVDDTEVSTDTPEGDVEVTDTETTTEVDPNVKAVQDALTQAQAAAQKLGDPKLTDQIGNTITFFTRAHVVDKGAVAEADEMEEGKKEYYKDAEADDAEHIKALEKDMEDDKDSSMKIKEVVFPMWTKLNK